MSDRRVLRTPAHPQSITVEAWPATRWPEDAVGSKEPTKTPGLYSTRAWDAASRSAVA